ncbi:MULTISPECIES: hypothetical protein [Fusobacterium]|nr:MULTISPECIES: hypothetical protein [Fusobacterium]EJU15582.1 hypothetical protein HMPREF1127_2036 [Fusobacterium necrophorum subsp. funduliforme Fnf 1007]MDK4477473.1 hypothetical protein [Fusobacterium necrophorum]MDK4486106.1 hypothetical protein [Fusobacterium necrophorum]
MFVLSISEENLKKLEEIGKHFGNLENKIVKEALRKAIQVAKKEDVKAIYRRYSIEKGAVAGANMKTKTTNLEAVLLGNTKRNKLSGFDISKKEPGKSKDYIKTHIVKYNPQFSWKTLFWAFWKNGTPKLMFRVGKERHKITNATSVSTRNMGLQLDDEVIFDKVQQTFTEILEKRIDEVWG